MKKLTQLREENSGYNPERAKDHGAKEVISRGQVFLKDSDGIWYKLTFAKNEREYIENFPRQMGLVSRGRFFIQL